MSFLYLFSKTPVSYQNFNFLHYPYQVYNLLIRQFHENDKNLPLNGGSKLPNVEWWVRGIMAKGEECLDSGILVKLLMNI